MKKLIKTLLLISLLTLANVAAAEPLTDAIVNVFKSDTSTIKYSIMQIQNSMNQVQKDQAKKVKYEFTLIRKGTDEVSIVDTYTTNKLASSMVSLYVNGESYSFGGTAKPAYNEQGLLKPSYGAMKMIGGGEKNSDANYKSYLFMIKYHFLPLMPEDNKAVIDGKELAVNSCTNFSKKGTELINGKSLVYMEYVSPKEYSVQSVTRYYFDNDRIVKCIRIDKEGTVPLDSDMAELLGKSTVEVGGYAIVDIKKMSLEANENFLKLPFKTKVIPFNSPAMY